MSHSSFARYALSSFITASVLAACSGSTPPTSALPVDVQVNPGASAASRDKALLYVADSDGSVAIISYPGGKEVGSIYYGLYSYLEGECADQSGNVWISDYDLIDKYPHGGTKPIWGKSVEWYLAGCSVAPGTNDVAAAGQHGTVFIWSGGRGRAKTYHTKPYYDLRYCGYDASGNLFVDGVDPYDSTKFLLFELPRGQKKLVRVSLDVKIGGAGQVQWDGRYLAIQDTDSPYDIYQVQVSGNAGTVVNTIALHELRGPVKASWIAGSLLFVPYSARGKSPNAIGVFDYPSGGEPIGTLHGKTYKYVDAVTLSR